MEFNPNSFYSASSNSSSSSSSSSSVMSLNYNKPVEKDFLSQMLEKNYEDSGIDVSLTLAPPEPPVRKCCICGETKTPLWRNGPHGPKSACNACGIRYRKDEAKINTELSLATPGSSVSKKCS